MELGNEHRIKVSVIVPNYNHGPYLEQRLESILNQTFQDFELIILDDASTDGSQKILETYEKHPKVSYCIFNEKNSESPFKQWVRGIRLAKGKFIWIAESDDFASVKFLEHTLKSLDQEKDTSLIYTDSAIIDKDNNKIDLWSSRKNIFFRTQKWSKDHVSNGLDEILNFLFYKVTINNTSAVLFKKKIFFEDNALETISGLKNAGDLFTYMFFGLKGNFKYLSLPLNNYREHEFNFTKKNQSEGIIHKERLLSYITIIKKITVFKITKATKAKIKKACQFIIQKNGFQLIENGDEKELFNFISKIYHAKIFNLIDKNVYYILFKIYTMNGKKGKYAIKKIINLIN